MLENNEKGTYGMQYDVIFVGQLGAVVCNILSNLNQTNHKYLVINDTKFVIQPALLPLQSAIINVQKNYPKKSEHQGEGIFKISPSHNTIIMKNKKIYKYRFLVYTSTPEQWSNYSIIQNLKPALQTNYSFNQPNISTADVILQRFQNTKNLQLKRKSIMQNTNIKMKQDNIENQIAQKQVISSETTINIIFYIPKPPHSGYDNLNILYKVDQFIQSFNTKTTKLKKKSQKISKRFSLNTKTTNDQPLQLNFILLLEGEDIFPYFFQLDHYTKSKIQEKGVKILKKHKIQKIDYLRRKITLLCTDKSQRDEFIPSLVKNITISYDYLYIYLKQKQTPLLQISGINPFNNCKKTLRNLQFKNVFIFGADIFPTTHSYIAINSQAHIISKNLLRLLENSTSKNTQNKNSVQSRLLQYKGFTQFKLWISRSQFVKISHQFPQQNLNQLNTNQKLEKINKNKIQDKKNCSCFPFFQEQKHKFLSNLETKLFYNLKSYGPPFYIFLPEIPHEQPKHKQS